MNVLTKIQNWGDRHHPKWLDYIRIVLGLTLVFNGISLAAHLHDFTVMMHNAMLGTAVTISLLAHFIIVLHLVGGLLIALGSHTRTFCLFNIFAVIAAIMFVSMQPHIYEPYALFWFSGLVLVGLVCFLIEGDGVLSIEHEDNLAA